MGGMVLQPVLLGAPQEDPCNHIHYTHISQIGGQGENSIAPGYTSSQNDECTGLFNMQFNLLHSLQVQEC